MKKILFLLLFITTLANGQGTLTTGEAFIIQPFLSTESVEVISKYDTTVLNTGDVKCIHDFVFKKEPVSYGSCAVMHGPEGCSANWMDAKCICTICLRHLRILETRSIKEKPDGYTVALNKLNQKKK